MGNLSFFERILENKLLGLHTAYLAKVISVNDRKAKIQPLGLVKFYGEEVAEARAPLTDVPILKNVEIVAGDIVLCVCCERDITEALKGNNTVPAIGHHSMHDSIIIGCL